MLSSPTPLTVAYPACLPPFLPTATPSIPKRILARALRLFSSDGLVCGVVGSGSNGLESPTPVPMPPTGQQASTVVSSQGDTIELVIHSPLKAAQLPRRRSLGWKGIGFGSGNIDDSDTQRYSDLTPAALGGGEKSRRRKKKAVPTTTTAPTATTKTTPPIAPSFSDDDDDAMSLVSVSELLRDTQIPPPRLTAALLDSREDAFSRTGSGESSAGRLADAFSEKWGAWVGEAHDNDSDEDFVAQSHRRLHSEHNQDGGNTGVGGRCARDFDNEALRLSPYDHQAYNPTPSSLTSGRYLATYPFSSTFSSLVTVNEDWIPDGRLSLSSGVTPAADLVALPWAENSSPHDSDTTRREKLRLVQGQPEALSVRSTDASAMTAGFSAGDGKSKDVWAVAKGPMDPISASNPLTERPPTWSYSSDRGYFDKRGKKNSGTMPSTAPRYSQGGPCKRDNETVQTSNADNFLPQPHMPAPLFNSIVQKRNTRGTMRAIATISDTGLTNRTKPGNYRGGRGSVLIKPFALRPSRRNGGIAGGNNRSGALGKTESREDTEAMLLEKKARTAWPTFEKSAKGLKEVDL